MDKRYIRENSVTLLNSLKREREREREREKERERERERERTKKPRPLFGDTCGT